MCGCVFGRGRSNTRVCCTKGKEESQRVRHKTSSMDEVIEARRALPQRLNFILNESRAQKSSDDSSA